MYLMYLIVLIVGWRHTAADCGCGSLNRNQNQCDIDSNRAAKYSQEKNNNNNGEQTSKQRMAAIEGGEFEMGTNSPVFASDQEGPLRNTTVDSFYLDKYEVSNEDFMQFVLKTGYQTEAELFGDSFIFEMMLPEQERAQHRDVRAVQAPWWIKLKGASWQQPQGPGSHITDKMNHPVVHVSWNDAVQYCQHLGLRLPTEQEWERACRAGLKRKLYPWGNKLMPNNKHWANLWQGDFPHTNTADDGYLFTAPIDEFPPNKFGLYNMAGNVWEWTQDNWLNDPQSKVKKGGSYLCHESYCWRYRCAARSFNTKDTSAANLGFRCAADF